MKGHVSENPADILRARVAVAEMQSLHIVRMGIPPADDVNYYYGNGCLFEIVPEIKKAASRN